MKHIYFAGIAAALAFGASAQTMTEWNQTDVTSINREPAVTVEIPVVDPSQPMEKSPYYSSLNGVWRFSWAPVPEKAPDATALSVSDILAMDTITVPYPWQVYAMHNGKGWDLPLYCNTEYPFTYNRETYDLNADRPGDWTYNNEMRNPVGTYVRDFTVPSSWKGRQVYLRFNGAGHGIYVWVNGKFIGYSEDSYLPAEFNITDALHKGNNTLAVQAYRFTTGSFLECQDYWRLTGLMRDVFLWSAPATNIRDFAFNTKLTDNYTKANVNIDIEPQGKQLRKGTLKAVISKDGKEVASGSVPTDGVSATAIAFDVDKPELWTAETPELYDLVITLSNGGKVIDTRATKVGFREVGVREDGALTINGKRILLRGVDRHDFSAKTGRTVPYEETEADILTMKRLNINAVRTSHYPDNPYFYDLCDKHGIYVLAEANVECHGDMHLSHVEQFKDAMVERSRNHVLRYRNHPSIFMWSYGNESGNGENFKSVEAAIKEVDKSRLTHYEGNSKWADVTSTMYADVNRIENIGRERAEQAAKGEKPRPHIQCENSHSMGNSMGNVREFWDLYEKYPALTGEFIWDFKDQGLDTPIPGGNGTYWAYGGDFGDRPNSGNFCCNGLVYPDLSLSAKSYNTKKIYQPVDFRLADGKLSVKNNLVFKSTEDYAISYELLEDGMPVAAGELNVVVPAGETLSVPFSPLPNGAKDNAEYFVRFSVRQKAPTAWAEAGYEVAAEQFKLKDAERGEYRPGEGGKLTLLEEDDYFVVKGNKFEARFSKSEGTLSEYIYEGKTLVSSPLKLNVFRLPTDNDKNHHWAWERAGLINPRVDAGAWTVSRTADSVELAVKDVYNCYHPWSFDVDYKFTVYGDGSVVVNSNIDPSVKDAVIPRIGFTLDMPAAYNNITWFGRGPWESYTDRKEACFEGVFSSTVAETLTHYVMPQENGTHQDVRWMALTDKGGKGVMFVAPDNMAAGAANWRIEDQYTTPNRRAMHPYQMKYADATIVNLDAAHRALGNASCGPDVLPKYELRSAPTSFDFIIIPVTEGTPASLSNKARAAK